MHVFMHRGPAIVHTLAPITLHDIRYGLTWQEVLTMEVTLHAQAVTVDILT